MFGLCGEEESRRVKMRNKLCRPANGFLGQGIFLMNGLEIEWISEMTVQYAEGRLHRARLGWMGLDGKVLEHCGQSSVARMPSTSLHSVSIWRRSME